MTRSDIRKYIIRAFILTLISALVIIALGQVLNDRSYREEQAELKDKLSLFLPADHYETVSKNLYSMHPSVRALYLAKDSAGKLLGFVLDVTVENKDGKLSTRMSISPDGDKVILLRIMNDDGTFADMNDPPVRDLCSQLQDVRIPVALRSQMSVEILTHNEYPSVEGLHDGVFFAQAEVFDKSQYKDYVEIRVSGGRIVSVSWNAVHKEEGEKNRAEASLSGAYSLGENQPLWVAQAYAIQNKLLEVQDPDKLAIKSDGTTEIVEGVHMDVHVFYELVVECIANSRNNIPKPTATPEPTEDPENSERKSKETDADPKSLTEVIPTGTTVFENTSVTVTETPTPTPGQVVIGNEDGFVDPDQNPILSDNVDGLPFSEIRTQIADIPDHPTLSVLTTRSVNMAYIFLREYLKWGA